MSEILKKVKGLFVEDTNITDSTTTNDHNSDIDTGSDAWKQWEEIANGKTSNTPMPLTDAIARQPGPDIDSVSVSLPQSPENKPVDELVMPKRRDDGTWDFSAIYVHSNLQSPAFTAEQAREFIASLPESLPLEVRRETVGKTLSAIAKTLSITPDVIASDAALKIATVEDFRGKIQQRFSEYEIKAQQAIVEYEKKIAETKANIELSKTRSADVMRACDAEVDKLDDVTEFFTLDIGSSKHGLTISETSKQVSN